VPRTTAPQPVRSCIKDNFLLDDAGAFEAYGKTGLIDGEINNVNAQHRPHARIKSRLQVALSNALRGIDSKFEPIDGSTVSTDQL